MTMERLRHSPDGRRVQSGHDYWQSPIIILEAFQTWEEMQAYGSEYYGQPLANPNRATSIDLWINIALEHWAKKL